MDRVILIGLSGTGKSAVASVLAERLGFAAIDTDAEVVSRVGMPIAEVFARFGEPAFRAFEREVLLDACARCRAVIATGGGVPADEANWPVMRPNSLIVLLTTEPGEILSRLRAQVAAEPGERRPLLESDDPASRLNALWQARKPFYRRADVTVETTGKTVKQVADEIAAMVAGRSGAHAVPVASIGVPTGRSDLYVAPGLLSTLGELVRQRWPEARRVWVVSDSNVLPLWGDRVRVALGSVGFETRAMVVPAGEASKSLEQVSALLDWLIDGRIDRRDVVVALGGGVVGDLAGFVAAIALRGVGLVQVPTSLLAMVDSSVGGKTGVNHALGKNLIGSFYQPQLVVADPLVLATIPERETRAGWAEIAKHAMIEMTATGAAEPALLRRLEALAPDELADPDVLAEIVRHNVLLKATVVRQDEREAGLRRLLNYGHTLGHAMEAAGYRYLHGEAIALGMRAAAELSVRLGRTSRDVVGRQGALLDRLRLPGRFEGDLDIVMERLTRDKKAVHGALIWILPTETIGSVDVVKGVPLETVEAVAMGLGARRLAG